MSQYPYCDLWKVHPFGQKFGINWSYFAKQYNLRDMFLKLEARQIKCTVYRSAKFLKFFVRFDHILYIFFEKLSASGGLRPPHPLPGLRPWTPLGTCPPDPWVCPSTRMLLPPLIVSWLSGGVDAPGWFNYLVVNYLKKLPTSFG